MKGFLKGIHEQGKPCYEVTITFNDVIKEKLLSTTGSTNVTAQL